VLDLFCRFLVLLYFHVERTITKNSYKPDLNAGISFLIVAILPLVQERVPLHLYKRGTPHSRATRGGWGYHAFKKSVGGQGTSRFWEWGVPLSKKRGPCPSKPSAGKIFIPTITPREAQVLGMQKRGVVPLLCPDRGWGYHVLKKLVGGWGYLSFLGVGGATQGLSGGGTPNGPRIASASPIKKF